MAEHKNIEMTFSNGDEWVIPLEFVAKHRTDYYSSKGEFEQDSKEYKEEFEWVMNDDYEAIDWLQNNMNWEDVEQVAKKKITGEVDFADELCNCEKDII